jgi:uncharacterized protein (TIGR02246 family)
MRNLTGRSLLVSMGFASLLGASILTTTDAHAFGLGGGTASDVKSEKAIRELYGDFVKSWNKHDVETIATRWAIDGDHVEPDGTVAKGRDAVTQLLTRQHQGVFKNSKLDLTVNSVWMISDSVALVDGTYQLTGAVLPDGSDIPPREGRLTSVLILERNSWSIAASRLMIPTKLPYKPKGPTPADAAAPKQNP